MAHLDEDKSWNEAGKTNKGVVDMVNRPPHYTFGKYEVIDVLEDWDLSPLLWQVVKYVSRAKHKGNELQDLKKAQFYLNRHINNLEKQRDEE